MRKLLRAQCGFTFVELLVTMALMTFIVGVTTSVLMGGLRVWERVADYGSGEQAAVITFERARRDLRSARTFTLIPFDGRYDRFSFTAVGWDRADQEGPKELGRLGYYHDHRSKTLCRTFVPYRRMKRVRLKDECEVVLDDVTRIRLRYFGPSERLRKLSQ